MRKEIVGLFYAYLQRMTRQQAIALIANKFGLTMSEVGKIINPGKAEYRPLTEKQICVNTPCTHCINPCKEI